MLKATEKILDAIKKVEGKGEPIISVGTTGSGKSALDEACAMHEATQHLLSLRVSSGKGSTATSSIIATDYKEIPEDKLIVTASLIFKTAAEFSDDNELLGNIIYEAAKNFSKNHDENQYKAKLKTVFNSSLQQPANDSLAYKIKDLNDNKKTELVNILSSFPVQDVMNIFNEASSRNTKKGQKGSQIFTELLSSKDSFKEAIQNFWSFIEQFLKQELDALKNELDASGAYIEKIQNENYRFIAILGEEDYDNPLVSKLLRSENGSKEYLLSDISLIFRGANYVFDFPDKDFLTVSEIDDTKIRCVRIIDTQGLFHTTGVKVKDESERIIDLLTEFHTNRLILVVNSFINDTVKNGYEAICTMLQEVNRDIDIYFFFTHWDEYLKNFGAQSSSGSRFSRRSEIDWKEKFLVAVSEQNDIENLFRNAIKSNTSKRTPQIIGCYRAAILSDSTNKMEDILEENGICYPSALKALFSDLVRNEAQRGHRFRVISSVDDCVDIDSSKLSAQNISALYENLLDCKDLKLYASTVRACVRKWTESGTIHNSFVAANEYGFQNIKTIFVQEIRNYSHQFLKSLSFDVSLLLSDSTDEHAFIEEMMAYFSANQKFGREVAKLIGKYAYEQGFCKDKTFKYQYARFTDMLQYAQDSYFMAKYIPCTETFKFCILEAAKKCVRNFVDSRCVVVY